MPSGARRVALGFDSVGGLRTDGGRGEVALGLEDRFSAPNASVDRGTESSSRPVPAGGRPPPRGPRPGRALPHWTKPAQGLQGGGARMPSREEADVPLELAERAVGAAPQDAVLLPRVEPEEVQLGLERADVIATKRRVPKVDDAIGEVVPGLDELVPRVLADERRRRSAGGAAGIRGRLSSVLGPKRPCSWGSIG